MGIIKSIFKLVKKPLFQPIINENKGIRGEQAVKSKLNPLVFGKVYHKQINNLIIVDERGHSHQIDHIEIRLNGIFCIETKNYSGLILGDANSEKWTQCLGRERNHFYNPVKQNNTHIYHLSKALGNSYKINNVIVMAQNNADKINLSNVVNLNKLTTYLNNFNDGISYTEQEVEAIYNKIEALISNLTTRQHVENINIQKRSVEQGICPECGGRLVLKNGRYGQFIGCSNYPKCRYTRNIRK